jgi:hypothetical protein
MECPAFTAGGLRCEFEHGMRAMKSVLRLARGAATKDRTASPLDRNLLQCPNSPGTEELPQ